MATEDSQLNEYILILNDLPNTQIPVFLRALRKYYTSEKESLDVQKRVDYVKVYQILVEVHGGSVQPHIPEILGNILPCLEDENETVFLVCMETIQTVVMAFTETSDNPADVLIEPVLNCLSENTYAVEALHLIAQLKPTVFDEQEIASYTFEELIKLQEDVIATDAWIKLVATLTDRVTVANLQGLHSLVVPLWYQILQLDGVDKHKVVTTFTSLASKVGAAVLSNQEKVLTLVKLLEELTANEESDICDIVSTALETLFSLSREMDQVETGEQEIQVIQTLVSSPSQSMGRSREDQPSHQAVTESDAPSPKPVMIASKSHACMNGNGTQREWQTRAPQSHMRPEVSHQFSSIDQRVLFDRLTGIQDTLDQLVRSTDQGFRQMESRIGRLEVAFDKLDVHSKRYGAGPPGPATSAGAGVAHTNLHPGIPTSVPRRQVPLSPIVMTSSSELRAAIQALNIGNVNVAFQTLLSPEDGVPQAHHLATLVAKIGPSHVNSMSDTVLAQILSFATSSQDNNLLSSLLGVIEMTLVVPTVHVQAILQWLYGVATSTSAHKTKASQLYSKLLPQTL